MNGKTVAYQDGDTRCLGTCYQPEGNENLPVILICPAVDGVVSEIHQKAQHIAELGYTTMTVDVYGEGKTLSHDEDYAPYVGPLMMDRALLLRRLQSAANAAQSLPYVDPQRLAAVGYCFGGLCALDLARAGTDGLKAVVSLHGGLAGNGLTDEQPATIGASILVLHGNEDPLVPPEQVREFTDEMNAAQADWQLVSFSHTMHAFTRPGAADPDNGIAYNERSDQRAWKMMQDFLAAEL